MITDKNTGRSKGYGFVTFQEPESARRACIDPAPVIDGRRANCNLASLGRPQRPTYATIGIYKITNAFFCKRVLFWKLWRSTTCFLQLPTRINVSIVHAWSIWL